MLWMSLFSSLCSLSLGQAFRPQCPPLTPSFPNSCVEFRCYDRQRDDYNRDTYCEQDGVRCRANTRIQQGNYVNCAYFYSERDLEVEVRKKKSQDQISFQISNSSLRYLPREAFSGIQIQEFTLKTSSLASLSDEEFAFEGLENTLRTLTFDSCTYTNDWDWGQLRKLSKLEYIGVINSDLLTVTEDLKQLSNIKYLNFDKNSISWIADDAFSRFPRLYMFYMNHNLIRKFKRSMFPNPADALYYFEVKYNQIETLPKDIFVNMPALGSVHLSGNKITTLDEDIFRPVWGKLAWLVFEDAPISCDCRLIWITQVIKGPSLVAECSRPKPLEKKKLWELTSDDLWC
uniref:U92-Liphistoxin-Lsp1b_1 n=1 Tax=Liphistius sp. SGP-2016 TaxID=1905180 RepID=A0A4Q8K6T3_9ARAC